MKERERERNICKEEDSNQQSIMNEMLAKIKRSNPHFHASSTSSASGQYSTDNWLLLTKFILGTRTPNRSVYIRISQTEKSFEWLTWLFDSALFGPPSQPTYRRVYRSFL